MAILPNKKQETTTDEQLVTYLRSVKNGTNLGSTQRKTHVTRVSSSNRVHGQTTRFICSGGESRHFVSFNGGAHLERTNDILLL